ncbi:flagellar motor protein MotB [Solirhodobacter olei]|uniref:flagellar motor protein MotB n=1 Tax=Solirhodobacter olei TaxID=2493082 RepID=UPI000FDAB972|nr:flagellar motor protein MotB [Solirhodobacter olei]
MPRSNAPAIIIRKVEDGHDHGHHGGAWKVAYADFMTAMMAFFLLMWIVSNASKAQLNGISDYFAPAKISMTAKGGTGALGGTTLGPKGTMSASNGINKPKGMDSGKPVKPVPDTHPLPQMTMQKSPAAAVTPMKTAALTPGKDAGKNPATRVVTKLVSDHALDKARFKAVEKEIVDTMKADKGLRPLLKNVLFKQTPEGLKIEVVDQKGRAMFASGSSKVEGPTLLLMQRLAKAISTLPNKIRISGHTDSVPYAEGANRDNWSLSSDRANATRRVFTASGVAADRITSISGVADTEPLKPADPTDPSNRRITVLLAYGPDAPAAATQSAVKVLNKAAQAAEAGVSVRAVPDASGTAPAGAAAASTPGRSAEASPAPAAKPLSPLEQQYSLITAADLMKKR